MALVSFSACRESEEEITPSGNYSPIRGGFPQGNSELDQRIYQIKQDAYVVSDNFMGIFVCLV